MCISFHRHPTQLTGEYEANSSVLIINHADHSLKEDRTACKAHTLSLSLSTRHQGDADGARAPGWFGFDCLSTLLATDSVYGELSVIWEPVSLPIVLFVGLFVFCHCIV